MDNSTHGVNEMLMQYLDGELTGTDREKLEQQLSADVNLRQEYEQLVLAREAIRQYGLQQKVTGIHQQMMEELKAPVRKINPVKRIIRYSMAAAAGVLLIIGGIMVYNFFALSSEKVFAANYRSYETNTLRDENTQELSTLEKAYAEKKYGEVTNTVFDRPFGIREIFLKAMAFMELGNTEKAIEHYKLVIMEAPATNLLKEEAEYYLMLAYIRHKEYSMALQQMDDIRKKPGHLYYNKITPALIRQVKALNSR